MTRGSRARSQSYHNPLRKKPFRMQLKLRNVTFVKKAQIKCKINNQKEKIVCWVLSQARVLFIAVKLNANRKLFTAQLQLQIKLCLEFNLISLAVKKLVPFGDTNLDVPENRFHRAILLFILKFLFSAELAVCTNDNLLSFGS